MDQINLKAYAKINLGLDIAGKREDGYHLLKTVFQTIDIHDNVNVRKTESGIILKTNKPYIPTDEKNIAYKAALKIISKYNLKAGVRIDIGKNIPVGGGMAGGSTDGAAVILAMNKLFNLNMSLTEMDEIAVGLGADVPFCLRKGTYLAEGIGEKLKKLNDIPDADILIFHPAFSVSTKWAYEKADAIKNPKHPQMDKVLDAIEKSDLKEISKYIENSFEEIVGEIHPEIFEIKKIMEDEGALKALMTGSGSSIFGIFESKEKAEKASLKLKQDYGNKNAYITKTVKGN